MLRSYLFLRSLLKEDYNLDKPFHEYGQCDYLGVGYETSKPMGSKRNEKL